MMTDDLPDEPIPRGYWLGFPADDPIPEGWRALEGKRPFLDDGVVYLMCEKL